MANEVTIQELSAQSQAIPISSTEELSQNIIPSKIEIGTIPVIIGVIVFVFGIGAAWGSIKNLVSSIKDTLNNDIKPDLKDIRERFGVVEDRVETLWQDKFAPARSPRQLNDLGNSILTKSGIKEIIEEKKLVLLEQIRKRPISNAYDAEQAILGVVVELPKHCPEIIEKLKTGAFNVGQNIDTVLYVGGIHLRNLVFSELGFSLTDLDKPKN